MPWTLPRWLPTVSNPSANHAKAHTYLSICNHHNQQRLLQPALPNFIIQQRLQNLTLHARPQLRCRPLEVYRVHDPFRLLSRADIVVVGVAAIVDEPDFNPGGVEHGRDFGDAPDEVFECGDAGSRVHGDAVVCGC